MQATTLSFEFFPPKTPEGFQKLGTVRGELASLNPSYFSVTYGAGGSTHEGTWNTVNACRDEGLAVAPHLSCIGATRGKLGELLQAYRDLGVRRIVALRGDLPSGYGMGGEFMHAVDLVRFIREQHGDWFDVEVAAYPEFHPQARSADEDLRRYVEKVQAGATGAITQYFYNSDAYFRFVEDSEKLGATVPVVPGIMPITNYTQLARFSDSCGAEIPRWIRLKLQSFADDAASLRAFGHDVVTDLCDQLLSAGVPGLHFYTMNQSGPTSAIVKALNLR